MNLTPEQQYWVDNGSVDATLVPADENGRHPKFKHLVMYELESHYGSYIVTSPAKSGSRLMSVDDCVHAFGEGVVDQGFGFAVDDYLDYFEES